MKAFGQLPDPRLPFALSFSKLFLDPSIKNVLSESDIIIATCPPWPPLLSALIIKRRFKKPIILDYRDQFSMCHEMPGGRIAKAIEVVVDRYLAQRAEALVAISQPMADYYSEFNRNTTVILNGYDPEPIEAAKASKQQTITNSPLIVRYLGLVSEGRIPRAMLTALSDLRREGAIPFKSLVFEYYGEVGLMQRHLETAHPELLDLFRFFPRVDYKKSLELITTADHLLFCENSIPPKPGETASASGILTTKLFEYLASERPIIANIGPETLAGSFIVRASDRHFVSDKPNDFRALFSSGRFLNPEPVETSDFVRELSRAAQANDYLRIVDAVTSESTLKTCKLAN